MVAVRRKNRTSGRARVLERMVKNNEWKYGAELGVLDGKTLLYLMRTCPELCMIGVDTWKYMPGMSDQRAPGFRDYADHDLEEYYQSLKRREDEFHGRMNLLRMTTAEAAKTVPDGWLDFVFIDADHTAEGVTKDIFAWAPKVRSTGWIMGHDFQRKFPSVVRVVREVLPKHRLFEDSVWGVPKSETVFA